MSELAARGGWVMIAILFASTGAWTLAVAKWLALRALRRRERAREGVLAAIARGDVSEAAALCERIIPGLSMVLTASARPDRRRPGAARALLDAEAEVARRHLAFLAALAAVAPLLGLLGTVLGISDAFAAVDASGAQDGGRLAAGVGRALTTTQAGLLSGLSILLVHGHLRGVAAREVQAVETWARRVSGAVGFRLNRNPSEFVG